MFSDESELTPEEQRLINKHLDFYRALDQGKRKPRTEAQRQFVAMCEGEREPQTPDEIAYRKYRIWEARHPPRPRNADIPVHPDPGDWCSNEGWKRMRAGNFADMKKRQRGD